VSSEALLLNSTGREREKRLQCQFQLFLFHRAEQIGEVYLFTDSLNFTIFYIYYSYNIATVVYNIYIREYIIVQHSCEASETLLVLDSRLYE
jgi:hypothetical protein